jgi:hypothetical protein
MSKLVSIDAEGRIVYDGLLTYEEKLEFDQLLNVLREKIPIVEADLSEKYGSSVLYKYYLGKVLGEFLDIYEVSELERRKFWDEIKILASNDDRKRADGVNSKTRSFYEQCFVLSRIEVEIVEKLSWRQWQDLLDRTKNREDERIYQWIKHKDKKLREDDWREFEKALHQYLKTKDTSVFPDKDLFDIYDSLLLMCTQWRLLFKDYLSTLDKTVEKRRIAKQKYYKEKYYKKCFETKKSLRKQIDMDMCQDVFVHIIPERSEKSEI